MFDEEDKLIGMFKQKLFSLGGAFSIFSSDEQPICQLKGKWTGWDFKFIAEERELAHVTKKMGWYW